MKKCHHCGHPLPDDTAPVELRGLQKRIFEAVSRASPTRISTLDIIGIIYADREDGGPLSAASVVKRTVFEINKKIKSFHLRIHGQGGRGDPGYRLIEIGDTQWEKMWRIPFEWRNFL